MRLSFRFLALHALPDHSQSRSSDTSFVVSLSTPLTAKILKRFIRQPRPELSKKKTYGMPSTHSSSISFFGVYLSLCISQLKPHPRFLPNLLSRRDDTEDLSPFVRFVLTTAVLYGAASVMWSRVRLTHHTPAQVVAGAAVGSSMAIACFILWQTVIVQYAPLVDSTVEDLLAVSLQSWHVKSLQPLSSSLQALHAEWRTSQL